MNPRVRSWLLACGLAAAAGCSGPPATAGRSGGASEGASAAAEPATAGTPADMAAAGAAAGPPAARPATGDAPPATAPAGTGAQRLRGNAIMGKDGYGITLCGEATQRIVGFDAGAQVMLDQFLAGGAREFFVDGWGGPAAGDHLQVTGIERLYREGPGCQEALSGVAFLARGNEPFWSLSAGQDGVRLDRPDQPTESVPFLVPESSAAGFSFAARTRTGSALTVQFTPGACRDGMSDTLYGWKVQVTLGDQAFSGCGFAGLPADRD